MSGRSAYVRQRGTSPSRKNSDPSNRSRSSTCSQTDNNDFFTISQDVPYALSPTGTGVGTTNARFLKFADPRSGAGGYIAADGEEWNYGGGSGGGRSGSRRMNTGRTEEVKGDKSGFRSAVERRSDGVRKGLAKTFAFRKKAKGGDRGGDERERPESAASASAMGSMPDSIPLEEVYTQDHHTSSYPSRPPTSISQHQPMSYPTYAAHPQQHALPSPTSPKSLQSAWDPIPIGPPPTTKLPPIPGAAGGGGAGVQIKRWFGAGRAVGRWNKLRRDPELWDRSGDVLIFLGRKGGTARQKPSFRLSSGIIRATESDYLITLLDEGYTGGSVNVSPPPSVVHQEGGQLTPPASEDANIPEEQDSHDFEIYFPTPPNLSKLDQLRHQITTRNVFALLCHASLVGLSLHQALTDLHTRLESYMAPENDNVGQMAHYVTARALDDVRSDPETAVSLLAWAEASEVRWEEGWRECFVHCAGMFGGELERCPDFKYVTPITRALLERASLEMQLRVQSAEERLSEFAFADMWPAGPFANVPARMAAERLRHMLLSHYTRAYGSWPPSSSHTASFQPGSYDSSEGETDAWLTRTVAMNLQRDFGALYEYLVNRDIVWDVSEARSSRKWMMVSKSGNRAFDADIADLPLTDMVIEWDNRLRFPHIPHAYPLVPESIPPSPSSSREGSLFRSSKKDTKPGPGNRAGGLDRRVQLAYTESTNIYSLGGTFVQNELVDSFVRFEKGDKIGEIDPAVARRGRWVLIYGILQILATVAVDDPHVRYLDKVPYHLNPRLNGMRIPPWGTAAVDEACHELSYCWTAPAGWGRKGRGELEIGVVMPRLASVTSFGSRVSE